MKFPLRFRCLNCFYFVRNDSAAVRTVYQQSSGGFIYL